MASIKEKQSEALERMFNFNKPSDAKETWDEPWKVLIYDVFCRDIISPLLRVGDLRKHGITLHMLLHSDRQPIPDVPALYFVLPTKDNIKRICEDCKNRLYDSFHLNFASSVPRPLLEELANATLESDSVHLISKVFDQYLNFVSLEKDLVTFNQKYSYVAFNDPAISDTQAELNIESTVEGLFSMCATMGVVPIIRCPRNGAPEAVASQLDTKLHEHLVNMGNLFSDTTSGYSQRPVLIILDRNTDLSVMLHHTWTYEALVHDLLGMTLNRVQLEVQEADDSGNKPKEVKSYDLDSTDAFWSQNSGTAFPNIAVAVNTYLKEYQGAVDEFNKMSGGVDIDQYDESQLLGKTKDLGSFVSAIPALREKKRIIDVHTNIATAILNHIKTRELDTYFSLEESMMIRSLTDKKEILALLSDPKRGTAEDKLRLFLIYIMSNEHISQTDMEQFEEALTKAGADLNVARYVKKTKAFHEGMSTTSTLSSPSTSARMGGLLSKVNVESLPGLGSSLTKNLGTLFTAGVKALLPTSKELYVTRIVDAIMEMKNDLGVENYLYFDPKKMRQASVARKNSPFKDAWVFVIGGGNYVEFLNLQEYAKKTPGKKILYGTTEMLNGSQFLHQLSDLASKK
eukprot:TRINITY_DN12296_c0_g1_i1.p1 TRINITY_DN12296_c0_g1~~TRINITY_DN12296_c0_g1_i1.p1  ORF type:complete len:628 (+),score=163.71 TRINITY_DN12296_c0_g1_i1:113-1996(+)